MQDEITLTLNSPLTDEDWDLITDTDFDHTDTIWFNTKNGKTVRFVKAVEEPCLSCQEFSCDGCKYKYERK